MSSDVLTYMQWAATLFRTVPRGPAGLRPLRGGQGWDLQIPARDADADQEAVHLARHFSAWGWGTWRDRWEALGA